MLSLVARRLAALVPLLLLVSLGVFGLVLLVPGDAATTLAGGVDARPERVEEIRDQLGLADPFLVQYGRWLGDAAQLDLGTSLQNDRSVSEELRRRFPVTGSLALAAFLVTLLVGVPAGIVAGMRAGGAVDQVALAGSSIGIAIPGFWLGIVLVTLLGVERDILPAIGYVPFTESPWEWLRHVTLPAIALGTAGAAVIARQLRAGLVDVLDSNYVRTAWAKGGGPLAVVGKHALKNAAIPTVTVAGLQIGVLLGGTVIIEQIFSIPGLGTYLITAIQAQDLPIIQGVTVLFVLVHVAVNLVVDLTYGYLNPKVRVS